MKQSPRNNLERMIQLAEEFFAAHQDPSQISVDGRVMQRLRRIHPSTITERRTRSGPVAWMLVIPTTRELMELFVSKKITERELYKNTPLHVPYQSVYLCSALVLPEYRGKGIASRMMMQAVKAICHDHPVQSLFFWGFSRAGRKLAVSVARSLSLPLYQRR